MALKTIGDVSGETGISTRMLRYYEQAGLIASLRRADYAYRVYDEEALRRLRQIVVLRKLRIPLRQIERILRHQDTVVALEVFRRSVEEMNAEIDALQSIRQVLTRLTALIGREPGVKLNPMLLEDQNIAGLIAELSPPEQTLKGEKIMEQLSRAEKKLTKLTDVRIVYLPPSSVAAYHYMGEDSEAHAQEVMNRFVLESGLLGVKPDIRHFGFNNPAQHAAYNASSPGYEMWVTIPDGFSVPEPLVLKRFLGGLYAAHAIDFGAFDHWGLLSEWVSESPQYAHDFGSVRAEPWDARMDPCLEEQLNYFHNVKQTDFDIARMQLDLLMPIR
jgi:DNA-binding transcriptional MerR regulator